MTGMSAIRARTLLVLGAALLWIGAARASWPPVPEGPALRLHPDLPEVLERDWLERLDLFPEVAGLARVRFGRAPWGGVVARLEVEDPDQGLRVLLRSLSGDRWQALTARTAAVLRGETPPLLPPEPAPQAGAADPLASVRSWPETPPPPAAPRPEQRLAGGRVPVRGHWLALVDAGVRVDLTAFNQFFTPMGQIGLAFGYGASERLVPLLGFFAGFGDMRGDFEDAFGDGRSNAFGFTLDLLARHPVGTRQSLYLEGGGGYFIRSLYWGGAFYDPVSGEITEGRVLEQQDFGWTLRVGWLLARDHPRRPRLLDIGVGVQTSTADSWNYWTENESFSAGDRDTWLVVTVRFWDGL